MEIKINITTILKNKPKGTKLYSTVHGKCTLEAITDEIFKINFCTSKFGLTQSGECILIKFGNMYDDGECVIFPSKEMRDWSKFAWKKGDVLVNKDGDVHIIFERFVDGTYCSFVGKYYLWKENNDTEQFYEKERLLTSDFNKANKEEAQKYIRQIEKRLGYKLNFENLKIEKSEFKDGDIVTIIPHIGDKLIYLFKAEDDEKYYGHAFLDGNIAIVNEDSYCQKAFCTARPSTDEEKQQLFSALAKKSKAWDAEKKQIVDLKPKVDVLKPFDRVLVRNCKSENWRANLFGYIDKDGFYCCVWANWAYCIPYIGNESLVGTTKDVED